MRNDDHPDEAGTSPRVLIVSEHASTRFGGEAILPWHYFRILRRRGIDARLIVHARTRDELLALLPDEADRIYFTPDTQINIIANKLCRFIPAQLGYITLGYISRLSTQWTARNLARRLVAEHRIDVVHQPIPVSPREPSLMHGFGVPVVIGPMNGNMSYPPAFVRRGRLKFLSAILSSARSASVMLHRVMPGKLRAAALLVANERTRLGLPAGVTGKIITLVENGVDRDLWSDTGRVSHTEGPVRFVFLGRLIDLKAVDILLDAFAQVRAAPLPLMEIIGDGPMRAELEDQVIRLRLGGRVQFAGWQPQIECARMLRESDVLVLPSLHECGGAVVLEAMACGLPVVATDWGGPADYLDASCGILIPTDSREVLVSGFAEAMSRLAADPDLRVTLGSAGRERVKRDFDWEVKCDQILAIYRDVCARNSSVTCEPVGSSPQTISVPRPESNASLEEIEVDFSD